MDLKLESLSAKKVEFWLFGYKSQKFIASGEILGESNENCFVSLKLDNCLMGILRFKLEYIKTNLIKIKKDSERRHFKRNIY